MAAPEAGNARHLLIFLDQRIGLPVDVLDRNLNHDLAFRGAFFSFSGAHNYLSKTAAPAETGGKSLGCDAGAATLSVKTLEEQRQTAKGDDLPTKVTARAFRVARTLLSAKSVQRMKSRGWESPASFKGESNSKSKSNSNSRGQECPRHTTKYNEGACRPPTGSRF